MKELGLDPKKFKYLKSDEHSTTLQHKDGHTMTIAHSVLSPKNQTVLKALASVPQQEDKKMAKGGPVEQSTPGPTMSSNSVGYADGGSVDAHLPCLNPSCKSQGKPHPNCKCHGGMAKGGPVMRYCAHGKPHEKGCMYEAGGQVGDHPRPDMDVYAGNVAVPPSKSQDYRDKTSPEQDQQRHAAQDASDIAFRASQPQQPAAMEETGYTNYAKGGTARKMYADQDEPVAQGDTAPVEVEGDVSNKPYGLFGISNRRPTEKDLEDKMKEKEAAQQQDSSPQDQPDAQAAPYNPDADEKDESGYGIHDPAEFAKAQEGYAKYKASLPPQNDQTSNQQPQQPQQGQPQAPPQQEAPPLDPDSFKSLVANSLLNEDQAWAKDLQDGHINPTTYKEMFGKKDTLGKIGTAFGLLISGAGSGLAHQPNAVMEMMKQELQNDMDAQKHSKVNAQNFLRMNQAHQLNQSTIRTQAANNQLTKAQALQALVDTQIKANALHQIQMNRTVFHDLTTKAAALPPGSPQRQQADNVLATLYGAVNNENFNIADRAAAASTLSNFGTAGSTDLKNDPEQAYQQDQRRMKMSGDANMERMAQDRDARHIPGIPGFASGPIPQEARDKLQAMNILDNKVKDVLNFAQQNRGSVNPQILKQARQKAEELTSFYNKSVDSLGMTSGRLGWLEEQIKKNPTSLMQQVLGNNATLKEIRDSNIGRRDQMLRGPGGLGFPPDPNQPQPTLPTPPVARPSRPEPPSPATANPSAPQVKWYRGKAYIRGPNGEAIETKQ